MDCLRCSIFHRFSSTRLCAKSRKCSKKYNHSGRCDSNRTVTNRFWVNSRSQVLNKLKRDFREKAEKKEEVIAEKFARINEKEEDLKVKEEDLKEKEEDLKEKEEDLNDKEREATEKLSRMESSSEEIGKGCNYVIYIKLCVWHSIFI